MFNRGQMCCEPLQTHALHTHGQLYWKRSSHGIVYLLYTLTVNKKHIRLYQFAELFNLQLLQNFNVDKVDQGVTAIMLQRGLDSLLQIT